MSVTGVPSDAAELYDISILGFLRSIHADSYSDCPHSHSQQQDHQCSFPKSSLEFAGICFLGDSHSDGYEKESQNDFNFHFLDGSGCRAPFQVFIGHLRFFGELSI